MKVGLIAYNWEANTSLALWNLVGYADQDPLIRSSVEWSTFVRPTPKSKNAEEVEFARVVDWLERGQFELIGFSAYIWSIDFVTRIARAVKELWPETIVVFGGQQIRGFYVQQLFERERCTDFCVVNEGEVPFRELLTALLGEKPSLSKIQGLAYYAHREDPDSFLRFSSDTVSIPSSFQFRSGGEGAPISDLNSIPSPYLDNQRLPKGGAFLYEASRGCPYRCSFCVWGESQGVREYSMDRVERELTTILAHQPSHIMFCDGTFNMRKDRASTILGILVDNLASGRVKPFSLLLELKLEIVDDRLVRVLDELVRLNPLVSVEFGLQSVSSEAARLMKRPFVEKKFRAAWGLLTEYLKRSAILDIIYGMPGDGTEEFKRNVDFCYSLGPHRIQCFRLSVLPGTEFDRTSDELGLSYSREPGHHVHRTKWLDLSEMRWIEAFAYAVTDLYAFHGTSIRCLMGHEKWARFSDLISDFVAWADPSTIVSSSDDGSRPEGRWRAINLSSSFKRFLNERVFPALDLSDSDRCRYSELLEYETKMGDVAMAGTPFGTGEPLGFRVNAKITKFNHDVPDLVSKARTKARISISEMRARPSIIAVTAKTGGEGVSIPVSYRVSEHVASVLEQIGSNGLRKQIKTSAVQRLVDAGLLVDQRAAGNTALGIAS